MTEVDEEPSSEEQSSEEIEPESTEPQPVTTNCQKKRRLSMSSVLASKCSKGVDIHTLVMKYLDYEALSSFYK